MKTLYFECKMGAAGDMLMAALYEICDQKELFLQTMNQARNMGFRFLRRNQKSAAFPAHICML